MKEHYIEQWLSYPPFINTFGPFAPPYLAHPTRISRSVGCKPNTVCPRATAESKLHRLQKLHVADMGHISHAFRPFTIGARTGWVWVAMDPGYPAVRVKLWLVKETSPALGRVRFPGFLVPGCAAGPSPRH
ncbi:hypothetical protein PsYK624_110240 [Phanerochaete sordida]|uniref:Uncharacterized protein n=1 Tax=Phanerochaete sordida TaxID=48140 RepID=A0A9P3GF08_9APHY|nr:hypothetical protein PsYK624_110240 [Phanerochaete sordida]